jgi:hypothetical protein
MYFGRLFFFIIGSTSSTRFFIILFCQTIKRFGTLSLILSSARALRFLFSVRQRFKGCQSARALNAF